MNIRQLRYFVAVAEERSFSRAALRLNVTQPPLSVQVKALEQNLGTRLLDRDRRSVALTATGTVLLDHARRILREFDLTRSAVRLAAEGSKGVIRIGYAGSVPMFPAFATLIGAFRASAPDVKLEMRHLATGRQLEMLIADDLDIGFVRPSSFHQPSPDLRMTPVWRDELMVFMTKSDPLAAADEPIDLCMLADRDVVAIAADVGCGVHEQAAVLWRTAGVVPRVVQEARELRTVLGLAAAGIGVAILPSCFRLVGVAHVTARPLANAEVESNMIMAHRAGPRPPLVDRFIDSFMALI